MSQVIELLPDAQSEHSLEGLYLKQDLRARDPDKGPFVYSNYIASLDGRIAVPDAGGDLGVPKNIANDRDWQLFQELAVQADLLFTSGRYLRDYARGDVQEILTVYEDPQFEYLRRWRAERGLRLYPDLAVISASSDFPIPAALRKDDRRVIVVTTRSAQPERLRELSKQAHLCFAGDESVDGGEMIRDLLSRGYRLMYNTTGPRVLHLLLAADSVDRLYITRTARVLGGRPYATIVEGDLFDPPLDFKLDRLYYDPAALEGAGQLFHIYERARPVL